MEAKEARKLWGGAIFIESDFKSGSTSRRAAMAADLVERNPYLGKSPAEVKEKLGRFTGYYWSHRIPAYLVSEGWAQNSDTWQLVFLLDQKGRVQEVKIHKNCCYNSQSSGIRKPSDK